MMQFSLFEESTLTPLNPYSLAVCSYLVLSLHNLQGRVLREVLFDLLSG